MKTVRKLRAVFTHPLEGYSLVTTDLAPLNPDAMTFNFPLSKGVHAQIRISVQEEHVQKPYPDGSPLREPSMEEVMGAIQLMYAMIAQGHLREQVVELPDDEPEGFEAAVMESGFAFDNRERAIAECFFRAGVEFANSNKESRASE